MVDDHRELRTGAYAADHAEGLRDRRARLRERRVVWSHRDADWGDGGVAVNQCGTNLICAAGKAAPIGRVRDKAPRTATLCCAERGGQFVERRGGGGRVVFHFHEADYVSAEPTQGGDSLCFLTIELDQRIGTARRREADARARAIAIEKIQHVERGYLDRAADCGRRQWARCKSEHRRRSGVDRMSPKRVREDAT